MLRSYVVFGPAFRLMLYVLATLLPLPMATGASAQGSSRTEEVLLLAGEASIGDEPPIRVHVELRRSGSRVAGQFTTEDATIPLAGTWFARSVRGHLNAGPLAGTTELRLDRTGATGIFVLGDQKGTLKLKKTAKDAGAFLRPPQIVDLGTAQWRQDLDELVRILTREHGGPFDHVSRRDFLAQVASIRTTIPRSNGPRIAIEFRKLAASVGDGHTGVDFVRGRPVFPFELYWFEDGLRLIAAPSEHRALLGAQVIAINDQPVAVLAGRMRAYIGQHETEEAYRGSFPYLVRRADLLADIGHSPATVTLRFSDGRGIGLDSGPERKDLTRLGRGAPLWERDAERGWVRRRLADGSLYINWRTYDDLDAKGVALFELLDRDRPRRLIIDLRDNTGGDYKVGRRLLAEIRKRPWLNGKDRLFVMIGRFTFSAAMTNAADFRTMTNATLVGEPAGAKPNGWQEVRRFFLPNSGLRVSVSTKRYDFLPGADAVRPDITLAPTPQDWTRDEDTALAFVLSRHTSPADPGQ